MQPGLFLGACPSLTSLLSFSLFMGPVLKFHGVGTSLMRRFDWSFLFPDACLTQRRLSEPYFSKRSQDFLYRVSPRLLASLQHIRVLRNAPQLWHNFHNSNSILVVAFSSFMGIVAFLWVFCLIVHYSFDVETNTSPGLCSPFQFVTLTFGRMPMFTRRSRANTPFKWCLHGCRRMAPWLFASDTPLPQQTSTS